MNVFHEIDRVMERVRQDAATHRARQFVDRVGRDLPIALPSAAPARGTRVFDPVSGEEGTVIDARTAHFVVPPAER